MKELRDSALRPVTLEMEHGRAAWCTYRATACTPHITEGERELVKLSLKRLALQFLSHHASCRAERKRSSC